MHHAAFQPTDRVLISPRYLAGTGADSLGNVIGPLTHLVDWHTTHDPATGLVTLDSPDHCLFITFEPMRFDGIWWTIAHHEPNWEVKFTRQTPVEAIAAVTQALPQLLGDHRHCEQIPLTPAARRASPPTVSGPPAATATASPRPTGTALCATHRKPQPPGPSTPRCARASTPSGAQSSPTPQNGWSPSSSPGSPPTSPSSRPSATSPTSCSTAPASSSPRSAVPR